ncbi:unnamed protein product, partial [Nesidiocoris tenuis]
MSLVEVLFTPREFGYFALTSNWVFYTKFITKGAYEQVLSGIRTGRTDLLHLKTVDSSIHQFSFLADHSHNAVVADGRIFIIFADGLISL